MKTIFLADDDADDREFFEEALNDLSIPAKLTTAKDGTELMNILSETVTELPPPPHVIFLDLNMPNKNGIECLEEIRKTPRLKNIPIAIFSTTSSESTVNQTFQLGANCYICKPTTHQLLKKAIEIVMNFEFWKNPQQLSKEKFVLKIS